MADEPSQDTVRRPGRWGTVRFRLTAVATLVVAVVLIAMGLVVVAAQRRVLTTSLDEALEQRAEEIEAVLAEPDWPDELPRSIDDDAIAQVVDMDDRVVLASANLPGDVPLADDPGASTARPLVDDPGASTASRMVVPPGETQAFRLLSHRIDTPTGVFVIHVAANPDDVDESVTALAASLALAIPVVTALLAGLLWWLTGRMLRPVEAIRTEVASIGGDELERRVPVPPTDDEIARLARTMNAMLDRVEESAQRQQQFVADASHDLRSPLTRIRSELEVDLAHPDRADLAATHESVLAETVQLQHLVDDLLHLARADASALPLERKEVDLDDLVLHEAQRLRENGRVQVDVHAVSAAQVSGDSRQLARAIRNLAENAERLAASTVTFEVSEGDGEAIVAVADDGPGIAPEDRLRVFERFTRLDDARQHDGGSAGLGLAIVADIVARHGGTVAVDPDHGPGARLVIHLPLRR